MSSGVGSADPDVVWPAVLIGTCEHCGMSRGGFDLSAGVAKVRPMAEFTGDDLSGSHVERVDLTGAETLVAVGAGRNRNVS